MIGACLLCFSGCAREPAPSPRQASEELHWRADQQAWEWAAVGLEQALVDCRVTPLLADDPVRPSDRAGYVLVTDGYLARLFVECARHGQVTP